MKKSVHPLTKLRTNGAGAVERSALVTASEDVWFLGSDGISIRAQRMCHPPCLAWQFQRYEVQAWLL